MKRALVSGASGLLGSNVVRSLRDKGVEVHALVRRLSDYNDPGVVPHLINLEEDFNLEQLPEGVDTVFHLAQAREYRDFPEFASRVFKINTLSTSKLLEYSKLVGVESFVYASSGGLYSQANQPIDEDSSLEHHTNVGHYLATKVASEALVSSYSSMIKTVVLRYFFIYGPGQNRGMMIPRIYDKVRNQELIQIQGVEGLALNPVHALDAAEATVISAESPKSLVSNVAGPETISIRQLANLFGLHTGVKPIFESLGEKEPRLVADITKMTSFYRPKILIKDSISDIST